MVTIAPPSGLVPILYDSQSTEAMPADIKTALDAYLSIVRNYTSTHTFPLTKLEISSFILPGEAHRYWVVTHWLDESTDPALDYWAEIDTEVVAKSATLPPDIATLVIEDISTNVQWNIE